MMAPMLHRGGRKGYDGANAVCMGVPPALTTTTTQEATLRLIKYITVHSIVLQCIYTPLKRTKMRKYTAHHYYSASHDETP